MHLKKIVVFILSCYFPLLLCVEKKPPKVLKLFNQTQSSENALYPIKSDLKKYLISITNGLDYFIEASIDEVYEKVNIILWLSLMNGNLKSALNVGSHNIDKDVKKYMEYLILVGEKSIKYYGKRLYTNDTMHLLYSKLADKEEILVNGLKRFNSDHASVSDIQMARYQQEWLTGCNYLKHSVFKMDKVNDTFYIFYPCIASLAKNQRRVPSNVNNYGLTHCKLKKKCKRMVKKWPNYGLYLVNRLMMLVLANHMRGCAITADDSGRIRSLCNQAFIESLYLAKYNKNMHTLMMFVALCSATGEQKFLQRSWFESLLSLQVPDGYFDGAIDRRYRQCAVTFIVEVWKLFPIDLMKWDVEQFTAVSLAALSSAVRYILQGHETQIQDLRTTTTLKPYGGHAPPSLV